MLFAAGKIPAGRCETLDGESVRTLFIFVGPIVFFATFLGVIDNDQTPPALNGSAKLTLLAIGAVWLAIIFLTGRTRGKDARQRRALARFLNHRAPPEILFDGTLALALEAKWESVAPEHVAYRVDATTKVKWRDLYPKDVAPDLLQLYYTLCRYDAAKSSDETMGNRARLAWERIEREN